MSILAFLLLAVFVPILVNEFTDSLRGLLHAWSGQRRGPCRLMFASGTPMNGWQSWTLLLGICRSSPWRSVSSFAPGHFCGHQRTPVHQGHGR